MAAPKRAYTNVSPQNPTASVFVPAGSHCRPLSPREIHKYQQVGLA